MASSVIVVGAVDGVRRELERRLRDRAELLIVRLARQGGFRLEPHPQSAVQMVEAASDRADNYGRVLIIQLPYASCPEPLLETVLALESLGATVIRPNPGVSTWPSRPKALDDRFRQSLQNALAAAIDEWLPGEAAPEENVDSAIGRARDDFSTTLQIPADLAVDTRLNGDFWYRVFRALDELCEIERRGEATNKREILRHLLGKHVQLPKATYKVADTGVFVTVPATGQRVELRERVHLREGRPSETESVYWTSIGETQASYRYLIGRIGRHA